MVSRIPGSINLSSDGFDSSQDMIKSFADYFSEVYLKSDALRWCVAQSNLPVCVDLKTISRLTPG